MGRSAQPVPGLLRREYETIADLRIREREPVQRVPFPSLSSSVVHRVVRVASAAAILRSQCPSPRLSRDEHPRSLSTSTRLTPSRNLSPLALAPGCPRASSQPTFSNPGRNDDSGRPAHSASILLVVCTTVHRTAKRSQFVPPWIRRRRRRSEREDLRLPPLLVRATFQATRAPQAPRPNAHEREALLVPDLLQSVRAFRQSRRPRLYFSFEGEKQSVNLSFK